MIDVTNYIQVIRCVHESVGIVEESRAIQNLFVSKKMISAWGRSPFDDYLIGHCISHHGGVWHVDINSKDEFHLLVQGLKSCNGSYAGKLQKLRITGIDFLMLDQILLSDLEQLHIEDCIFSASCVAMLQEYISSNRTLKTFHVQDCEHVESLLPIVFGPSSLESLSITAILRNIHINSDTMNLLVNNSNLSQLKLRYFQKLPASLCENSSLDYLVGNLFPLIKLIKLNYNLQKIKIDIEEVTGQFDVEVIYEMETESKKVVKLILRDTSNCNFTQQLLLRIPEQYHNFLQIE